MASHENLGGIETFRLQTGVEMQFDPNLSLRPDEGSEEMGYQAAEVLNFIWHRNRDLGRPLRVLDISCGTGVCLMACLSHAAAPTEIEGLGIDIDEYSIQQTNQNLSSLLGEGRSIKAEALQADWYDNALWPALSQRPWDVIVSNFPYLAAGTSVRAGYGNTPRQRMYVEGDDQLVHYRQVLPLTTRLLS